MIYIQVEGLSLPGLITSRMIGSFEREWIIFGNRITYRLDADCSSAEHKAKLQREGALGRCPLASRIRAREQVVLATKSDSPQGALGSVVSVSSMVGRCRGRRVYEIA